MHRFDLFKLYVSEEDIGARSQISCSGKNLIPLISKVIGEINDHNEKIYSICNKIAKNLNLKKREVNGFYHFRSGATNKEQLKKWKDYFEANTEKWFKINDFLNGFNKKVKDEKEAIEVLDKIYNHSRLIDIKSIIEILKEVKCVDRFYLSKRLGIGASTVFKYLKILEMSNIVKRTNNPGCFPKVLHDIENIRVVLSDDLHKNIFSKFKDYTNEEICDKLNICGTTYRNWKYKRFDKINISKLFLIKNVFKVKVNMNDLIFGKKLYRFNNKYNEWLIPERPWFNS